MAFNPVNRWWRPFCSKLVRWNHDAYDLSLIRSETVLTGYIGDTWTVEMGDIR